MDAPFNQRRARCPYCMEPFQSWYHGEWVEACRRCERLIVLIQSPFDWQGPLPVRSLIDIGSGACCVAVLLLVTLFVLAGLTAITFADALTSLLFVLGSFLYPDDGLGVRIQVDRTWNRLRFGTAAW